MNLNRLVGGKLNMTSYKKDAKAIRKLHGMRQIKTGKRRCLRCDNLFISTDTVTNKMCEPCRRYTDD